MNLDNIEEFKKYDKGDVLGSVRLLADQIEQAWTESLATDVPQSCTLAKQVVVSGMGGSALGGRIIDSLFQSALRTPMEIFTEYSAPNYIGPGTLVIVSSYSGNTEETVSFAYEAYQKNAQIYVISTGGRLSEFKEKYNLPGYIFTPKNNPSGQPRLALGYSVAAILAVLARCEFLSLPKEVMSEAIKTTRSFLNDFAPDKTESENSAKKMARELKGKFPFLVASEHLVGASHAFKNQLNESSKSFAAAFDLPELNHHLMEGLRNPAEVKEHMKFLLFESDHYSSRVRARYPITKAVIEQNEIQVASYKTLAKTKLSEAFEVLAFGSFVQFYLAMLYELDPSPVPWVDYFKEELAKVH